MPRSNSRAEPRLCACWRIAGYSKSTRPVHSKPFTNSSSLTGARRAGLRSFTHYHDGKSGYLSQSSLPLYFGLGTAEGIDRVEVLWPSGSRQEVTKDLLLNGLLTIKEVEAAKGKAKSE